MKYNVAILGGGNIGTAIAQGLVASKQFQPQQVSITRRKLELLQPLVKKNFQVMRDNCKAIEQAKVIILAVAPHQLKDLMDEIVHDLQCDNHILISVVSGVTIRELNNLTGPKKPAIVRAMPNTAIAIRESMTCLSADASETEALEVAKEIFDNVGKTMVIEEGQIGSATSLCACGIAFFLRTIRAASQGGIEIGFHPEEALVMAAQTAKGAASLLLDSDNHPEREIDKVTTPRGITITGLNKMEHSGFSSAMIKGIITSAEKAAQIYM